MDRPDVDLTPWTLVRFVPVTVIAVAFVCWVLAANEIRFHQVFALHPLNPFAYVFNGVFHEDWGHFAGNMRLWIPFGIALTWLTSNRHLLFLALVAQVLASTVSFAIGQVGVGLSIVVFAVAAATLVRSVGWAMTNASMEGLQAGLITVFTPLALGFLLVSILAGGNTPIAHFGHFFGFLFGGAVEAMYVFSEKESGTDGSGGREIPGDLGG